MNDVRAQIIELQDEVDRLRKDLSRHEVAQLKEAERLYRKGQWPGFREALATAMPYSLEGESTAQEIHSRLRPRP